MPASYQATEEGFGEPVGRKNGKLLRMFPKRATSSHAFFRPPGCHEQKGRRPALIISNFFFQSSYGIGDRLPDHEY
jgi:hypothetical protein